MSANSCMAGVLFVDGDVGGAPAAVLASTSVRIPMALVNVDMQEGWQAPARPTCKNSLFIIGSGAPGRGAS